MQAYPVLIMIGAQGAFAQKPVFLAFGKEGIVVVKYDKNEIKAVTERLVQESKDRGEGKLKQMAASMQAVGTYCDMLAQKSMADILAQSNENFLIAGESLNRIKLDEKTDMENNQDSYVLTVKSSNGKYKFNLRPYNGQIRELKKTGKTLYPGVFK